MEKEIQEKIERIKEERKILRRNSIYYKAQDAFELEKQGLTLREIGKELGVSHEYARLMIIRYQAGYYQ